MTKKKVEEKKVMKLSPKETTKGGFLTLMRAGQWLILPGSKELKQGTIAVFNAYRGDKTEKVVGLVNPKGYRQSCFDSYGECVSYKGLVMSLSMKPANDKPNADLVRVVEFHGNTPEMLK